jgi:flavin reductase (DIM6/NTAB) family NADH-FMN oxidoreductase RutF
VEDLGAEQRALFRRWPAGVSVVVAEVDGRRAALTVSSLVSLSLDPPLVGISIAHQAPIALWNGIDVREDDPRLLTGAAGWFIARTVDEHRTGDHTFFVGEVLSVEVGNAADSLTYVHHSYRAV